MPFPRGPEGGGKKLPRHLHCCHFSFPSLCLRPNNLQASQILSLATSELMLRSSNSRRLLFLPPGVVGPAERAPHRRTKAVQSDAEEVWGAVREEVGVGRVNIMRAGEYERKIPYIYLRQTKKVKIISEASERFH